jgi:hypothetical protein
MKSAWHEFNHQGERKITRYGELIASAVDKALKIRKAQAEKQQ